MRIWTELSHKFFWIGPRLSQRRKVQHLGLFVQGRKVFRQLFPFFDVLRSTWIKTLILIRHI